jgi:hypothetical protein
MTSRRGENIFAYFLVTGLALSIGWGIRGNYGHEYGAMIPGALAAMAAVLLVGRSDWLPSLPLFAMFGALGWSFGGSQSYMQVIGYTHSGHSPSVLYGFACLFVIGFLWSAPGGAGTALVAVAGRGRAAELLPVIGLVFVAWWLQGVLIEPVLKSLGVGLDWYDTDWLAALLALLTALGVVAYRKGFDRATSLVVHMAGGWWFGFVVLVLVLGLRMTPPRGDNWSGCLGMTAGILVYCQRTGLGEVARAALITGFLGGIGFAAASMVKLVLVTSGYTTNWHSVLEQTTGLFNGLALAVAMWDLAGRPARLGAEGEVATDEAVGVGHGPGYPWAESVAIGFVLLVIPYLNLRKNVGDWTVKSVPKAMYGIPAWAWFDLAFGVVAAGFLVLLIRHARRPLAVVPESPLGRGQGLFLLFLAITVVGNFAKALVGFADQRLITEGVIHANAVITSVLLLVSDPLPRFADAPATGEARTPLRWGTLVATGLVATVAAIVIDWAVVRAIYGDRFAGHANLHIRFGPNATIQSSKGR